MRKAKPNWQVQVDNRDGALMPGIHAEVSIKLAQSEPPIVVPATSVLIRSEGPTVAVVQSAQRIHLQKVELGRDLGVSIEIVSGLADNATIVLNPSDILKEGTQVLSQANASGESVAQLVRK